MNLTSYQLNLELAEMAAQNVNVLEVHEPNNTAEADNANAVSNVPTLEGSSTTYRAWSRSYVEMYTIQHEWTIDNFIELDEEAQVQFKVAVEDSQTELKFKLSIKPRHGDNKDYVSLYVHNLNKRDLKYSLVFSLVTEDKQKKMTRRADTKLHMSNESWGFPKFCQRSDILDPAISAQMLPEGTLTVLCEIGGFKKITTRSDFSRVRDKFKYEQHNDIVRDLAELFERSMDVNGSEMENADCKLVCGGQEFPCHRFMLSARSNVFRAMFGHAETVEAREGRVDLDDTAEPEVLRQFLRFVYTDDFDDKSFGTVSRLLPLAERYNVKRLSDMCGASMLDNMNAENVSEIAVIGELFKVPLLRGKAIEFISQYPERVMRTAGWQRLLKEAPDVCSDIICRLSRVGCGNGNDSKVTFMSRSMAVTPSSSSGLGSSMSSNANVSLSN